MQTILSRAISNIIIMANFKFIKLITKVALFSVLLMTYSCTDLEVSETDSDFIESAGGSIDADPSELLNTNYNDLAAFTDQANIYSLYAHSSDEMIPPTRGVDWGDNGVWRTLHAHTWDASHSFVTNAWNQLNERVFRTTRTLAASGISPQQTAEAKFLRALYMHHVMDLWGVVPFREVNEGVGVDPRVLTRSEAFDYIVGDLEAALPDLPVIGPGANAAASQASANALLAKLYLNKAVYTSGTPEGPYDFSGADMDKVIEYADAVAADGYALSGFFENFAPATTSETIFVSPTGSPQNRIWMTTHYDQNPSGWNGFTTLADFYGKFEDGDIRKGIPAAANGDAFSGIGYGFLIGQQYNDDGTPTIDSRTTLPLQFTPDVPLAGATTDKGIRVMKYHPSNYLDTKYVIQRYGDVALMKAEALMRKGDNAAALAAVNELRASRNAADLTTLDEATMLDERARELYWEGIRRTDQIRFGTFTEAWSEKTNTESFRVLYPIPALALASNPNLSQNAGY